MERGRGGRDDFFGGFGDPFAGFGGFGRTGSMMPSLFGGRDPFDDPFFNRPFGGLMGPSMFGQGMFGPSMFGGQNSLFRQPVDVEFMDKAPPANLSKGPVIEELSSDDEEEGEKGEKQTKEKLRNHSRSMKEPYVQRPDGSTEEKNNRYINHRNDLSHSRTIPQGQSYSFQSSTVTYGGINGAYYTASTTRRTGSDGVTMEESKEADTTTGKATHRISRGIHDKGHSVTRKLGSDGKVDTMQMLHNLNEDELPVFEEAWKGSAQKHLPGWSAGQDILRSSSNRGREEPSKGWALPSTEQPQEAAARMKTESRAGSFKARGSHK